MRRSLLPLLAALGAGVLAILAPSCSCSGGSNGCKRTTCVAAGANCGTIKDGCGGKLDCGFCGGQMTCGGGGTANVCGGASGTCSKATCSSTGATCGTLSDGCGGQIHCGFCRAGETCGGGGTAWQCGVGGNCTPTTCAAQGADCGAIPDGCGGYLQCGACQSGQTCGGDGTPNQCGTGSCVPTGTCQSGDCGFVSDGCGKALDCGGCTTTQICKLGATCVAGGPGAVGGSCTTGSDCPGGVCLGPSDGWPNGYCSAWCTTDSDCGGTGVCAGKNGAGRGVCVAACTTTADCRTGYTCNLLGTGAHACTPAGTGSGGVGDPCTSVADCSGGNGAICLGTGQGMPGGYCTQICSGSASGTCPTGSHCAFKSGGAVCVKSCTTSADCRAGYTCSDWDGDGTTECVPSAPIGAPCTQDSDCGGGACLTQGKTGWTGGYCTGTCTSSSDCGSGSQCVTGSDGIHRCLKSCQTNQDCRSGYACISDPTGGGGVCEAYGGGTGKVGDPCTSVADCSGGSNAICDTSGGGFPGGYCSLSCTSGGSSPCPTGSTCVTSSDNGGQCKRTCTSNGDCRTGYTCQPTGNGTSVCEAGGIVGGSGVTGSACTANAQCKGLACRDQAHTGWRGGYCVGGCESNADCKRQGGGHCGEKHTAKGVTVGVCLASCQSDSDCRTGYKCWDEDGDGVNECAPYGSGTSAVGAPCTTIDQCANKAAATCLVRLDGYPKGYCSAACGNGSSCPTHSHCSHPHGGNQGICLNAPCCDAYVPCTYDSQNQIYSCPQGMHCVYNTFGKLGHTCAYDGESCDATHACPDGHECSGTTGNCMACANNAATCRNDYDCYDLDQDGKLECWPAAKGNGAVGVPCTQLRDCSGGVHGVCLYQDGQTDPGGMCARNCTDGTPCPSGTACINPAANAPVQTKQIVKLCLKVCSGNADCRTGYQCTQLDPNQPNVCFSIH